MRKLFAFFKRFQVFLFFVALQGLALSSYFTNFAFPRSQYLTSTSEINGRILTVQNEVTKHFNLAYNNQKLQRENIDLRARLPQSFIKLENGLTKINDTLYKLQYEYIPAQVINSTYDKNKNYFTLNIGSEQGVKWDMAVITDKGIVGIVRQVSPHFCIVKSVLNENINIDVMIAKTGDYGILKWNGRSPRVGTISSISNDVAIKKWSKVVTRGGSGLFPPGIPVGKVRKLNQVEGKPLWDIEVLYSEDYRKIQNVYVIRNILKTEQHALESFIPKDKP